MHLFALPKPLFRSLGGDLFRRAPHLPGVYIMTGEKERILYVGQSRDLRSRLASYKNARADRAPAKVLRLVREVRAITWEVCESPEGARLRENELLRIHRPKFNRMNTYPRAYSFIELQQADQELRLARTTDPGPNAELYGAFKPGLMVGFTALLRILWVCLNQVTDHWRIPSQLLTAKPPKSFLFDCIESPDFLSPGVVFRLREFLAGQSEYLIGFLTQQLPASDNLSPFQRALHASDLETLTNFYQRGPKKLAELTARYNCPSPIVPQDCLDDLFVP